MGEVDVKNAIDYLEMQKRLFPNSANVLSGNFDLAIAALKKQMPKKVVKVTYRWPNGSEYEKCFCPGCHEYLSHDEKHCSNCGQCLDWGENE